MGQTANPTYIGRLAPSPTGLLHLGHARTFHTAWTRARAANGKLWLRDEDLDLQRSRPDFALAMREDLRWLGLDWDAELRQSKRLPLYREALNRLLALGLAYPCTCSRRDLALMVTAPHEDTGDEPLYPGHCRPIPSGRPTTIPLEATNLRFCVPDDTLIRFTDLAAGPQAFRSGCAPNADFGDFLIWRKDGLPSYQLACAVDDHLTGVTEVVRGRDLLLSTARQILLQQALGYRTPSYFHCELLRDDHGIRLAKRHNALSLRGLREQGLTPDQVLAMF